MTVLLSALSLSKSYGSRSLFHDLSLVITEKDRVGLIGPNGSGKSTLLKILAGLETRTSGDVVQRSSLKIGYVPQTADFPDIPVKELLLEKAKEPHKASVWLSKVGFSGEELSAAKLSGGWKKRLSIALAMVEEPDLLFLDEPTNHLDVESIIWLEGFLKREAPTYLLVSHDRYFLQNTTNRIIEINPAYPKGLFTIEGNYEEFLRRKEEFLSGQITQEKGIASKARREAAWLLQGAKARTTKAQSRINEAEKIFAEHKDLVKRNKQVLAEIAFVSSKRETRKLIAAKNVGYGSLFSHLDIVLSPGTRLGLLGKNGSGKTTLLKLFAGELEPTQGTIKRADDLKIVYFDQHRLKIPLETTLKEALSPEGDYVTYHGQQIHVNGWCKRFLFSPDILNLPISILSGGERARIAIAHLMLQSADILLLDEPTNDLDIPTLEILEESLLEFPGALVLITHDRHMLEKLCTEKVTLVGTPQHKPDVLPKREPLPAAPSSKLSYKERKEYEGIEAEISKKEALLSVKSAALEVESDGAKLQELCIEVACLEKEIEQLYLRFSELDARAF